MILGPINLSWTQFDICNPDSQIAFERMCRALFNQHFFNGKELLHSNPNNPGIEVLPILHAATDRRISFQSKYLTSNDYSQIRNSAKKIIKHYLGLVDVVYLYCNRDLTTTAAPYLEIEELLRSNGMDLVLINNQSILEQLLQYPSIATYYFKHHPINDKWFKDNLETSLDSLGARHNSLFNVTTTTEKNIDLFSLNNEGLFQINIRKVQAIERLSRRHLNIGNQTSYLVKAKEIIESFEDITINNAHTCLEWESTFNKV